jgi:protein CpxP
MRFDETKPNHDTSLTEAGICQEDLTMNKGLLKIASAVLVFGLAAFGVRAIAQSVSSDSAHKEHRERMTPDQHLAHLSKTLNLTDDQKAQIRPILDDMQQKMQSVHTDSSLSEQDKKSRMRSTFEDGHTRIRAVLNDTQKLKFDEMQQRRHEQMEKHEGKN